MDNAPALVLSPPPGLHLLEIVGNGIVGGMETYVRRLLERLPQARFRVTALLPYECVLAEELRALHAQVFVVPMPEEPSWGSVQSTCALIRAQNIDVVHAHLPPAHALAGVAGRLAGRPVLTSIHGRQLNMLDLEVHRAAGTHLHVVCEHSRWHALGLGVDPASVTCIPNGVDTELFRPAAAGDGGPAASGEQHGLRHELQLHDGTALVAFVGRLSPEKGPELFVRAAALLHRSLPDLHFVIVGDGPLRGAVSAAIDRSALGGRVHLVGERPDMPALYRQFDLLVSSSYSEAMPLAQMEALASGLPVVATRVGGVPELLEHGRTGFLVAAGDAEGLAGAVANLVQTPGLLHTMGTRARERAVERFGIDTSVRRMAHLLERLRAGNAPHPAHDGMAAAGAATPDADGHRPAARRSAASPRVA